MKCALRMTLTIPEVRGTEALLGLFFVSNFSAFLSEALLGLFCKNFFFPHFSLSDYSAESSKLQMIGSTEKKNQQMRKNPQNHHPC